MTTKHTSGPWKRQKRGDGKVIFIMARDGERERILCEVNRDDCDEAVAEADASLMAAAPAYALAWSLVPDEIKQRIFDALHKPNTGWVEPAIDAAEGR